MDNRFIQRECATHGLVTFVADLGTYRCLKCRSSGVIAWRKRLKAKLIDVCGGACVLCGYSKYHGGMDFHHTDPSTKFFAIASSGMTHSWKDNLEEVKKCVLLCCRCHREVEAGVATLPQDLDAVCPQRRFEFLEKVKRARVKVPRATKAQYPENLGELVWSKPVEAVARDLGISGKAVAKYCKRRGIATPPRGYWTKLNSLLLFSSLIPLL